MSWPRRGGHFGRLLLVKLVQMPTDLIHIQDADLNARVLGERLLAAFRAYLPGVTADRRGVAILAPSEAGADRALMVLARTVGAALRDANIALRDSGGDIKAQKQRLCYVPGNALGPAFSTSGAWEMLRHEAAVFVQALELAWMPDRVVAPPSRGVALDRHDITASVSTSEVLALLDERLMAGRPTFLTADPSRLPPGLEAVLRARLPILE